ncbi:OmpA family protein [Variovorax ginsengisoli]|uniref:OmpA family protein n=1 Tax=Variovorax ginsengisoli TaxID=363844 RepID=A0ABT8S0D0_9BURK|nr:OmpA family protein [Variovorax ginsengisoli]MDN8613196.1 OmpA family protein [Variovorax ginsengisoli]MDO1532366.1 OmpA family protein [Variovorax ginsengisoli]
MTPRSHCLLVTLLASALLAACSTPPTTRVVLLPQADGKPSAVVVSTEDGEETLSQPYERATAKLGAHGAPNVDKADPERVKQQNKTLFELMPPPAQSFTVYFEVGGTVLTAASQVTMNEALAAALARSGGEIVVTGHTDTVGTQARNDNLSLTRALEIRQLFIARDFPPVRIEAVGRGERDLPVRTADEVAEPRNRRVTIEVR